MKSVLLVLVAVSTCIGISTAASNYTHAAFKTCVGLLMNRGNSSCLSGKLGDIFKGQLDAAVKCNSIQFAKLASNMCTTDSQSGDHCGVATAYTADINIAMLGPCSSTIYGSATCSSECRNRLTAIRNDLGCCINAIYNYTDSVYAYSVPVFSYSVWSTCGVEPPTNTCTGALPFTLPTTPPCSYSELQSKWLGATCAPSTIDAIQAAVKSIGDPSCEGYMEYYKDLCSLDANGTFCLATASGTSDSDRFITPIMKVCLSATSCSPECKSILQDFANSRGCCVNALYNSAYSIAVFNTTVVDDWLFKLCGVESPPQSCKVPTSAF